MKRPDIIRFTTDPELLGLSLSPAQEALLRAIYGLPLTKAQKAIWRDATGRERYVRHAVREATVVAGARAGKDSRIAAPVVCYEAVFGGHDKHLARGERGLAALVAQDRRAAGIAFGYIKAGLEQSALLRDLIDGEPTTSEIRLTNGITIACFPSTLTSLRGWSIPVGVMDELAFFRLEGMIHSDAEIQASIRRGQIGFPNPKLIKVSTPYMKSGVLFDDFSRYWGADERDVLVWRMGSAEMNPTLAGKLEQLRKLDPQRFAREYEAQFADDLAAFLGWEQIDRAVVRGRSELPPQPGMTYYAAVDPSGGGADAFTCSIVHGDEGTVVQDVLRGWVRRAGQSPDLRGVVAEIASLVKEYGLREVTGDRYAAGWVRQAFRDEAITYTESRLDKTAAYLELLPLFSRDQIAILEHARQERELQSLERRTRVGGKYVVDHPRGGHDDYANVLALAAAAVTATKRELRVGRFWPGSSGGVLLEFD
jgi:hypothetical protein